MTPRDALAEGRLSDAVTLQEAAVRDRPDDPAARLFLVELLALAGRLREAWDHLGRVASDDPAWPASRRAFRRLLKAEHRRSHLHRRPKFLGEVPRHARCRWRAVVAMRDGAPDAAADWVDRADAAAPEVRGHIDGREFEGLRDTDDRFGSVLEAFAGADYVWVPFEQVRRLALAPAAGVLDAAFRPARLRLAGGEDLAVVLPLLYPGSHAADGPFACGQDADWTSTDGGPLVGVGARVLMFGEEELVLGECKQIEVR